MATKHANQHVVHELTVGIHETLDTSSGSIVKKQEVDCGYSDGHRVHGHHAETQPHPELRISVADQDGFLWTSAYPFKVTIPKAGPGLFYRPLPWHSTLGNDGLHRVASGPLNSLASTIMPKLGMQFKFEITRQLPTNPPMDDPAFEALDPHFIAEP